jgi:hypothetical protein
MVEPGRECSGTKLFRYFLRRLEIYIGNKDPRSALGESLGSRSSYAASSTGDDNHLIGKLEHSSLPVLVRPFARTPL